MKKVIGFIVVLLIMLTFSSQLYSCTALYIARDNVIFAGNNEDWFDFKTKMWFVPAENGKLGRVYFGFSDFISQGGMNENGLFFDGFATDPLEVVNSKGKPHFNGRLADHVLATCSTVEEVIAVFKKYNLEGFENGMLMFGDAYGKSVIIEGDDFVMKEGEYQICTNFYQSKTKTSDIDCWRYLKADKMLKLNAAVTVDLCKSILKADHVDFTQYSNVYDLKNKKVYLYHYHNFESVVEIDLSEELKKGKQTYDISSLFPPNEVFIKRSKSKVTPVNNKVLFFFLIFSSFVFLSTPITLILLKRRLGGKLPEDKKDKFFLFKPAQIVASVAAITSVIFLIALSQYPELFHTGLPQNLQGFSIGQIVLIRLPLLAAALDVVMIVFIVIVLLKKLWTNRLGAFYIFVALLLFVNLVLLFYWNLLKI